MQSLVKECLWPSETRRGKEESFHMAFGDSVALPTLTLASGLWHCETGHFCCCKLPSLMCCVLPAQEITHLLCPQAPELGPCGQFSYSQLPARPSSPDTSGSGNA